MSKNNSKGNSQKGSKPTDVTQEVSKGYNSDSKISKGGSYKGQNKDRSKKGKPTRNYGSENRRNDSDSTIGNRKPFDGVKGNDINWWNKSPMYADVTRVPFNRVYGAGITKRLNPELSHLVDTNARLHMSGIMAIEYVPSIGSSFNANSAVNRAFNSLFGELYSKTTGTPPIQQMDVAMFITSLASVSTLIGMMKRALGVSQLYSNWNYNFPRNLLQAMRFDPDTVIGWQDELRYALNDCILNFNNLKVPDIMDIYVRQYALAHNVYCDEDDVTSAMYVFNPKGYYVYDDTANPAKLRWVSLDSTSFTATSIIDAINYCLEAWRNSSDLPLISGTIQRAFPETQTISLDYVMESDVVIPTVDRNIMWQINNMNVTDWEESTFDITQDPVNNILIFDPEPVGTIANFISCGGQDYFLNSYDGNTGDEFIMEATRLITFPNGETGAPMVPTEFVTGVQAWYSQQSQKGGDPTFGSISVPSTVTYESSMGPNDIESFVTMVGVLSQFKYHHYVYVYAKEIGESALYICKAQIGDIYKVTTIDSYALEGLHKAATQSLYKLFTK